ncbi:hypothetical protein FA15DRAFT_691558 [Coprinopsis marcescibilis]|uniref:Uncharacterized protein n=1 Tax=Coprinopsis marcescibilis TaxID=230819 RepID=A0A5C3L6Z3_COPMA|nr:hypothetical protein FA15DRAFT_691558 [Coprinopsis marcescibilis]
MSTTASPNESPIGTPIQPLHNPSLAAQIVVPQAPLGNVVNAPGLGAKALLAKKMAKSHNPAFISPTDNLMTPCTQKLNAAKKKQFTKGSKPVQLFGQPNATTASDEDDDEDMSPVQPEAKSSNSPLKLEADDENPF